LLGFYLGRACRSFISDSLIAGHLGLAMFFSPSEVVAQSTDPFAGSEQRRDSPEPRGCGGQGLAPVPPERSMALHCWVASAGCSPPGLHPRAHAVVFGYAHV